jgi:hypothetical protein
MPEPETIEVTLALYGQQSGPVYMSRETAKHYAEQMIGRTILSREADYMRIAALPSVKYRILSTRLEDDNPGDPERGRVVAICQPVQQRQMEVK